MRLLIATDAFPPACGGSGWSTWELGRALRARGHQIVFVQPRPGSGADGERHYDGFRIIEIAARAPGVPFVRNYFKNERLWAQLASRLREVARDNRSDLIHAQHVLTAPAAVEAAHGLDLPVVCTVRDYWPVCYWGTLIHDPASPTLCPGCSAAAMTRCLRPRAGAAWPIALPWIPYMRGNLARKQRALGRADAIVAVSGAIKRDLEQRSVELGRTRIEVIPNPVDVAGLRERVGTMAPRLSGRYAIFVGKLEQNKGVAYLLPAVERARLPWPLVVVGEGAERGRLESGARAAGRDVRFTGWLPRDEALAWLAHASLVVFPSYGPESLSRVLLESAVLGVPIAAMNTGGTVDIVEHDVTGLLSSTPEELSSHVARLVSDRALSGRLAAGAAAHMERSFDAAQVAARMEALYASLLDGKPRRAQ